MHTHTHPITTMSGASVNPAISGAREVGGAAVPTFHVTANNLQARI